MDLTKLRIKLEAGMKVEIFENGWIDIRDKNDNTILSQSNDGEKWTKYEYDKNGNQICLNRYDGYWVVIRYNEDSNPVFYQDSSGYWCKHEFDKNGNVVYYENSDGDIKDNRPPFKMDAERLEVLLCNTILFARDVSISELNKEYLVKQIGITKKELDSLDIDCYN